MSDVLAINNSPRQTCASYALDCMSVRRRFLASKDERKIALRRKSVACDSSSCKLTLLFVRKTISCVG